MEKYFDYMTGHKDIFDILKNHARYNRRFQTDAERMLWEHIRGGQLGVKFRRQHPIDDFIADFACITKKIIIEIDGGYHNNPEQRAEDERRSKIINTYNYYVMRFTNEEVMLSIDYVLEKIKSVISSIDKK